MTVKTTLSFTDRHHLFLSEKVSEGVYATDIHVHGVGSEGVVVSAAGDLSKQIDVSRR